MSRCFPYPPPGYVKNGIRDEALIEMIKLQREGEKAKKERKKEKKREKKEKEKVRGSGEIESKKHRHKKRHKDERDQEDQKGENLLKKTENELEKSSLTEEHGHPVGSQNSSDSTLNSNKRQKLSSPPDGRHNSGSIIRIRLPLQRHKDPEVLPSEEQPSTASGGSDDASTQGMHQPALRAGREGTELSCSTSRETCPELTLRVNEEKRCFLTTASESCAQTVETAVPSILCGSCSPQLASKFRDVIENWVPPPIQSDCSLFDDQEWLFETKQNQISGAKISEVDSFGLPHANSITLPHVCYLPGADIYALPFTVPY